jgi:hypothetical protein
MDEDDLPPKEGAPREPTVAGSLGWWMGTLVWLGLFVIVAGGVLYAAAHWSH